MIEDYILPGRENGIGLSDLAKVADISERSVRKEIELARIERGKLICGDENGYYEAANAEEIRDYIRRRKASIRTSTKSLKPFLMAVRE